MSSFNSTDIFLSTTYPSRFTIGEYQARNIYNSIPGINGAWSQHLGVGPRTIVVEGILGHTSVVNLKAQISTILTYINYGTATLRDNYAVGHYTDYSYCQFVSFRYGDMPGGFNGRITQSGSNYLTHYTAQFVQLTPTTAQA